MKGKRTTCWAGLVVLAMIVLGGFQPAVAAPPTGEVKTVAPTLGNQNPIPYLEVPHANDWIQLLFDHLVGCTPDVKFSTDLGLAHKWEMSPDGLSWTFYIRKGVKFHDGVELTAKDVKFSIEQFMLPDALSDDAAFIKEQVKSIEVKDPYTLVVHCKKPNIFVLNLFNNMEGQAGMVVPKDYYEKVGKDGFAKHPIGSGPYKVHSQQVGSFIKLEATEKHWRDGVPKYKYMTYTIIPEENTRMAMLRTGEADIARISRDAVKDAQGAGLNWIRKANGGVVSFYFTQSWTSPVFSDMRFRKALNLAIDRDAINKQLCGGLAKPFGAWPASKILAVGGDPNKQKPYPYDLQEARRLIKEGGWEGHEFGLISYDRAGFPELPKVAEALAGYWQKIGLKPKIIVSEWGVWRRTRFEPKGQNMIYCTDDTINPGRWGPVDQVCGEVLCPELKISTVNIPEVNEKIDRMDKTMNISEISKLMIEVSRYSYDHYLMIPICETFDEIATTKRIPKWDLGLRRNDRNYYDLIKQR